MTERDIVEICKETFAKANMKFDIPVKLNGRLKRTLGRCSYSIFNGVAIPSLIEISRDLAESDNIEQITETTIHECAHAIVALQTGERHGHDYVWKDTCHKLGIAGDRCAKQPASQDYKYICTCKECGKIVGRYFRAGRVVKEPWFYHCKCGGEITVEQLFQEVSL